MLHRVAKSIMSQAAVGGRAVAVSTLVVLCLGLTLPFVSEIRAAPRSGATARTEGAKTRTRSASRTHGSRKQKVRRRRSARAAHGRKRRATRAPVRATERTTKQATVSRRQGDASAPTTADLGGGSGHPGRSLWTAAISLGALGLAILAVIGGVLQRRGHFPFAGRGRKQQEAKRGRALEERLLEARSSSEEKRPPGNTQELASEAKLLESCLRAEKQFFLLPHRPELAGTLSARISARFASTPSPERLEGALRTLLDYAIRRSGGAGADFSISERTLAVQITGSGGLWKEYVERRLPAGLLEKLDSAHGEFDESIRDDRGNRLLLIRTL